MNRRHDQRGSALVVLLLAAAVEALSFTVFGGQVYTPGFAIVDSPQPGTPLGGDYLQVAIDVTANGMLPLPQDIASDSPSLIHNITVFLSSYDTKHNLTISNGTASADSAALGPVLYQEQGSTVKHVNWVWPDCLVGSGQPIALDSARGVYNISIRQSFRLNGVDHYTIFDLPISVTNTISSSTARTSAGTRPSCAELENPLLSPEQINATAANSVGLFLTPGGSTQVNVKGNSDDATGTGLGPSRPEANPSNGLGSTASRSLVPPFFVVPVVGLTAIVLYTSVYA